MRVAIVGTGNQGTALGFALRRAGHSVCFGSRDPAHAPPVSEGPVLTIAEAVRQAEVIALVVPSWHLGDTLQRLRGTEYAGKVVIDVSNPLASDGTSAADPTSSNAEKVAAALPGARVAKAFNTVFSAWLRTDGRALGEQLTGFVAADDPEAKRVALRLGKEIGLDPVDAGALSAARLLESAGVMLVRFGASTSLGWELGLRLVHPRDPKQSDSG